MENTFCYCCLKDAKHVNEYGVCAVCVDEAKMLEFEQQEESQRYYDSLRYTVVGSNGFRWDATSLWHQHHKV